MFLQADKAIVLAVDTFDQNSASPHLEVALAAARKAGEISRGYYAGNFTVTTKEDLTPVTQADVECEEAIREIILTAFPNHGFYGEETGQTQADAEYLWLVDPIDGTKGFVRQYPFFSTQIALIRVLVRLLPIVSLVGLCFGCIIRATHFAQRTTSQ